MSEDGEKKEKGNTPPFDGEKDETTSFTGDIVGKSYHGLGIVSALFFNLNWIRKNINTSTFLFFLFLFFFFFFFLLLLFFLKYSLDPST
jgi:hypothetical protein